MFDELVFSAIRKYGMLTQGDSVTVGLSGGADSVALLSFLLRFREELGITVAAAHLNHRLRGEESLRDQRFAERLCEGWGVPLRVESREIARLAGERGISVELCAREERYAFFREAGGKTATAHNATDNVETVLLNLARGTALTGLCGIPPVRGNIIRPLLECPRAEIERYLRGRGIAFVTDSTNETDDYARNRIRRHVLPGLRSVNPALEKHVTGMTELLRQDAIYLEQAAEEAAARLSTGKGRYSRAVYLSLPESVSARVLLLLLKELGVQPEKSRVELLDRVIRRGGPPVQLPTPAGVEGYRRGAGPRLLVEPDSFCFR